MKYTNYSNYIFEEVGGGGVPAQPEGQPQPGTPPEGQPTGSSGQSEQSGQSGIVQGLKDVLTMVLCATSGVTSGSTSNSNSSNCVPELPDPCSRQYQVGDICLYYPYEQVGGGYTGQHPFEPKQVVVTKVEGMEPGYIQIKYNNQPSTPSAGNSGSSGSSGASGGNRTFLGKCQFLRKLDNNPTTKQFTPNKPIWLWDTASRKHYPVMFVRKEGNNAVYYLCNDQQKTEKQIDYRYIRESKEILFNDYNDFLRNNI